MVLLGYIKEPTAALAKTQVKLVNNRKQLLLQQRLFCFRIIWVNFIAILFGLKPSKVLCRTKRRGDLNWLFGQQPVEM
jgi:hypothetical protein